MPIINNWTLIIYYLNFKYSPEPIIYNRKLYITKPQGSSINKPGSKYSPGPIIYKRSLFKTAATDPIYYTLAARGLEELFSSCAVVSVICSGGK
jgi:hypothetical protein